MQVLTEGLEGYSISEQERLEQREQLQQSGRHRVEGLVQQAADTALSRMKDRSARLFASSHHLQHHLVLHKLHGVQGSLQCW